MQLLAKSPSDSAWQDLPINRDNPSFRQTDTLEIFLPLFWNFRWRNVSEFEKKKIKMVFHHVRWILCFTELRVYQGLGTKVDPKSYFIRRISTEILIKYEIENNLHQNWWNNTDLTDKTKLEINFDPKPLGCFLVLQLYSGITHKIRHLYMRNFMETSTEAVIMRILLIFKVFIFSTNFIINK
jgi:hypothetical protein